MTSTAFSRPNGSHEPEPSDPAPDSTVLSVEFLDALADEPSPALSAAFTRAREVVHRVD